MKLGYLQVICFSFVVAASSAIFKPEKNKTELSLGELAPLKWKIVLQSNESVKSFRIPRLNCSILWSSNETVQSNRCANGNKINITFAKEANLTHFKTYEIVLNNLLDFPYGEYRALLVVRRNNKIIRMECSQHLIYDPTVNVDIYDEKKNKNYSGSSKYGWGGAAASVAFAAAIAVVLSFLMVYIKRRRAQMVK